MTEQLHPRDSERLDPGLCCVSAIAAFYRIASDPLRLAHDLALTTKSAEVGDVVHAAKSLGLKARIIEADDKRLANLPLPAIVMLRKGGFRVLSGRAQSDSFRVLDPVTRIAEEIAANDLATILEPTVVLIARKLGGAGIDPATFGFRWFLPSLWRYRKPIGNVLIGSLFIQILALTTPMFFQVVIDKVLTHKGYSTLFVLVGGLAAIGAFDVALQYLRTCTLSHTTNRIDVELGARLFHHLMRLPISYFETRPTGQTVARVRELETVRSFLTGQGLFSALDLVFTFIFIAVLFAYSWKLTLIVVLSIPFYLLIAGVIRPPLRSAINEKFNRGALSQQFLVETMVGAQTIKAAAVEPAMQTRWEERLAAYVTTAFGATMLGAKGQNAIQYVSKLTTALLLLFGAKTVIDGEMTVGSLVAFNMIAGQITQPILRLSQLWQDFQQIQVSVARLGDILNTPMEPTPSARVVLPAPKGHVACKNVNFRYRPGAPLILRDINLEIKAGESIGVVGPSGSGKSTLTKLLQRFYIPEEGHILLDGVDIAHVDPAWLRMNLGVVLQESTLFNCSIHDNIAFANPAMPRTMVIAAAKTSGADEFIVKLPKGYDTEIDERGANLSGGQRQRIAIARALIANPPILIFDEATSALDYQSERIVQRNMRQIAKGRTMILIAHRLATVKDCNRIVGMVDGRIVEVGTHAELLRKPNGLYANLWAMQSAGDAT
jgi:subfamily B ATP-binding cassette protein HlyB/CyaB